MNSLKRLKTTLLAVTIFMVAAFVLSPQKAMAQECIDFLASMHEASLLNFPPAMDRTVDAFFDSGGVATFTKLAGYDPNTYIGCTGWAQEQLGTDIGGGCDETPVELCNQLGELYYSDFEPQEGRRESRLAGSLLGISQTLEQYATTQPVPVSLALFVDDNLDRLPFVQRSLAQTNYGHALVNAVLDVWKVSRNVALAMMSVVLLVMGFLIITRKRISQQVVVNVQYALPKVVVALILIIFSYPIGATMASLFWSMFHNIPNMINSLYGAVSVTGGEILAGSLGAIIVVILGYMAASAMTAGLSLFLLVAVLGVLIGMVVYFWIKVLSIYIKMVFSIISAPVEFVIGAIPGSDDKIMGWFKRMVTYGLSLALMGAMTSFTRILGGLVISDYQNYATGLGDFVGFLAVPLLWIFGYGMAIGMPKRVEDFMSGGKAGRR